MSKKLWFEAEGSWYLPMIDPQGNRVIASQISRSGMDGERGDWLIHSSSNDAPLRFDDATVRATFLVDREALKAQISRIEDMARAQEDFAEHQDGMIAYRQQKDMAYNLSRFAQACNEVLRLGRLPDFPVSESDGRQGRISVGGVPVFSAEKITSQDAIDYAVARIQASFSDPSVMPVWIAKNVRCDIPASVVREVMQVIAERGGNRGESVEFASVGAQREVALDAILRAGTEYTMGVPITDAWCQEHWEKSGNRATHKMVNIARELLAPQEMQAIRQANPGEVRSIRTGEVLSMPFNADGHFDGDQCEDQKSGRMSHSHEEG